MRTLAEFGFDGRSVLEHLVSASSWGSIDQAVASLSVFAHPDVVAAAGGRALFRTIRGKRKGEIVGGAMEDDNTSPAQAFEWSTGFRRRVGTDIQCCHLYAASTDPDAYTDLCNIFMVPACLAKLTDSQAADLPARHVLRALRYRAFVLFGYRGPGRSSPPDRPDHYDDLAWAEPIGGGTKPDELERRLRDRLSSRRKDRLTKSVARCGWTFSHYRPDPEIVYAGS